MFVLYRCLFGALFALEVILKRQAMRCMACPTFPEPHQPPSTRQQQVQINAACPHHLLTHFITPTSPRSTRSRKRGWDATMPPEDAVGAAGLENGGEAKVSGGLDSSQHSQHTQQQQQRRPFPGGETKANSGLGLGLDSSQHSQHSQHSQQRRPLPALEHQPSSSQADTVVNRKLSSLGAGYDTQFVLHAPSIFHIPSSIWSHGVLPHERNAKEKRQAKRRTRKTTWRRRLRHFIHIPTTPFLKNWRYHRECLVADAWSGLILAVMLIPQVRGWCWLCGGV